MKKGFTLVELMVIIALLGVIAVMASTAVIGIMDRSKTSLSQTQINTLEDAAEKWGVVNADKMPLDNSVYSLDIQTLADEGYIDSADLKNPENKEKLCGVVEISFDNTKNQYKYNFVQKTC